MDNIKYIQKKRYATKNYALTNLYYLGKHISTHIADFLKDKEYIFNDSTQAGGVLTDNCKLDLKNFIDSNNQFNILKTNKDKGAKAEKNKNMNNRNDSIIEIKECFKEDTDYTNEKLGNDIDDYVYYYNNKTNVSMNNMADSLSEQFSKWLNSSDSKVTTNRTEKADNIHNEPDNNTVSVASHDGDTIPESKTETPISDTPKTSNTLPILLISTSKSEEGSVEDDTQKIVDEIVNSIAPHDNAKSTDQSYYQSGGDITESKKKINELLQNNRTMLRQLVYLCLLSKYYSIHDTPYSPPTIIDAEYANLLTKLLHLWMFTFLTRNSFGSKDNKTCILSKTAYDNIKNLKYKQLHETLFDSKNVRDMCLLDDSLNEQTVFKYLQNHMEEIDRGGANSSSGTSNIDKTVSDIKSKLCSVIFILLVTNHTTIINIGTSPSIDMYSIINGITNTTKFKSITRLYEKKDDKGGLKVQEAYNKCSTFIPNTPNTYDIDDIPDAALSITIPIDISNINIALQSIPNYQPIVYPTNSNPPITNSPEIDALFNAIKSYVDENTKQVFLEPDLLYPKETSGGYLRKNKGKSQRRYGPLNPTRHKIRRQKHSMKIHYAKNNSKTGKKYNRK